MGRQRSTTTLVLCILLTSPVVSWPTAANAVEAVRYEHPVDAPVTDAFRPPRNRYGAGNRGLEYRTRPGQRVTAAGSGRVAFAGVVAGRRVVSIEHADGLRTTYSGLATIVVGGGTRVRGGERIGTASSSLHFGVRVGRAYLDPARLLDDRPRVHLVESPDRRSRGLTPARHHDSARASSERLSMGPIAAFGVYTDSSPGGGREELASARRQPRLHPQTHRSRVRPTVADLARSALWTR